MPEQQTLRVLFVGLGTSRLCWYRCALPAMYMGGDWVGMVGPPLRTVTGFSMQGKLGTDFRAYDIVVVQQFRGGAKLKLIRELRKRGVLVLYEIDDYLHGIRRLERHDFAEHFSKKDLAEYELCMQECDGIICSTEYIARRYSRWGTTYVCENGLDMGRYRLSRSARPTVNGVPTVTIGWAGGTGHVTAMRPWLRTVEKLMLEHDHVFFASIGQPFAAELDKRLAGRVVSLPFMALENYPPAMTVFDIVLAPTHDGAFFRGKSTLRAMEAAALGLPCVASPHYTEAIERGTTGEIVTNEDELTEALTRLIESPEERQLMGDAARDKAIDEFSMEHRVDAWKIGMMAAWHAR